MKKGLLVFILIFFAFVGFAQQNLSVSLDNPVYGVLESLQVRALCSSLPTSKPYSRARILMALKEALENEDKLYILEKDVLLHYIDEFSGNLDYKWYQTGSYIYDSEKLKNKKTQDKNSIEVSSVEDGNDLVSENSFASKDKETEGDVSVFIETGLNWVTDFNVDAVSRGIGSDNFGTFFVRGNISKYFSYNINVAGGLALYNINAYEPFSYKKSWTGTVYPLKDDDFGHNSNSLPNKISGALNLKPEFALSFWDNKLAIRLAKIDRDWGYGNGGVMISKDAVSFSALDICINPIDWFNISQTVGWLEPEFGAGANELNNSKSFQNMYSATKVEFFIDKYAYLAAFSSVVFLKRPELSYAIPGLPASVSQSSIGDFDNVQLGGTLGFKYPGWIDFYYSFFCDEAKFNTSAESFFHKDRNMFANQLGVRFEIPKVPFTSLNIQYTKVEPYMYTHPIINTPYMPNEMSTTYSNGGQNLGYFLEPNSDELLFSLKTNPFWFFNANAKYSMIRHGIDVDGSSLFGKPLSYSNLLTTPLYNKNFLKDGVYEWFHTLGFEGEVDLRFIDPAIPIKLGFGYHFIYKYHTSWTGGKIPSGEKKKGETFSKIVGGHKTYINNSKYKNSQQHIFSLTFKLF